LCIARRKVLLNYYDKLPGLNARAKVIAKTIDVSSGEHISDGISAYTSSTTTSYYVSFEFDDRRVNVLVDVSLYNTLKENDAGTLIYMEDDEFIFIDFNRNP